MKYPVVAKLISLITIAYINLQAVDCLIPTKACHDPTGDGLQLKFVRDAHVLKGCTVYIGSVFIIMYRMNTPAEVNVTTYPELREITGSLVFNLVAGKQLTSLSLMFPNLRVIRGNQFFYGFTLLFYFNNQLLDMALPSLTRIQRGNVRIQQNREMCYHSTIKWSSLMGTNDSPDKVIAKSLRANCPSCPSRCNGYCWNSEHCQIICDNCGESGCDSNGKCCHFQCLGGCSGPSAKDCYVCRHQNYNGTCRTGCPIDTFEMEGHCFERCLQGYYIHLNSRKCVRKCPIGWTEDESTKICVVCNNCKRECEVKDKEGKNLIISSVDHQLQNLRECTVLKGNLIIRITYGSGDIVKELENALSSVEEIEGYLDISSTPSIVSLEFLKRLKIIHGKQLARADKTGQGYAIVIFDNRNLENLWTERSQHKLQVKRGKLFFHFNPRLCYNKIMTLAKQIGQENTTSIVDVPRQTNGDQNQCIIYPINITVFHGNSNYYRRRVTLNVTWEPIASNQFGGSNMLVNHIVYYRTTTTTNLTVYDGVDACGVKVWQEIIIAPDKNTVAIKNLKANTIYAVYVKTITISDIGAISNIKYYTVPDLQPTPIRNVEYINLSPSSIRISWDPPSSPNGLNITYKVIYEQLIAEDILPSKVCTDSGNVDSNIVVNPGIDIKTTPTISANNSCPCLSTTTTSINQADITDIRREDQNFFEYLNKIAFYQKTPAPSTVSTANITISTTAATVLTTEAAAATTIIPTNITLENATVASRNSTLSSITIATTPLLSTSTPSPLPVVEKHIRNTYIILHNLDPFTKYLITIIPCNSKCPIAGQDSSTDLYNVRTLPEVTRDDIKNISFRKIAESYEVIMLWSPPINPNGGHILAYEIRIYRFDDKSRYMAGTKHDQLESRCIPASEYNETNGYSIKLGRSGYYIIDVRATSLAGNGTWAGNISIELAKLGDQNQVVTISVVISTVIFTIIVACGAVWYTRRIKRKSKEFIESNNPNYMNEEDITCIPAIWEFERDKVNLLKELGKGAFGMVYLGEAHGIIHGESKTKVAVKTVNEKATFLQRQEFLNEACIMTELECNHIVRLLGIVSKGIPPLVIMEFMIRGDLKNYLRSLREDADNADYYTRPNPNRPTDIQFHKMAAEIADGMLYLEDRKFLHRDLATRNCLVNGDLVVKIGDFGLTRDIYTSDYYHKNEKGPLPVRWMPPESIRDSIFTSASDVWSYGITLWEITTLAEQPYPGKSNEDVVKYVLDGGCPERPPFCSDKLYHLLAKCTQFQAKMRPKFRTIIDLLLPDLPDTFQDVSYYHSEECAQAVVKKNGRNTERVKVITLGEEITEAYDVERTQVDHDVNLSLLDRNVRCLHDQRSEANDYYGEYCSRNLTSDSSILNSQDGSHTCPKNVTSPHGIMEEHYTLNDVSDAKISKSLPCIAITDNPLRNSQLCKTLSSPKMFT